MRLRHGRASSTSSNSPTSCSPASCRSRRTTRSRRAGELAEVQPGRRVRRRVRQLGRVVDTDDGLVVVDTSGVFHAKHVHETIRGVVAPAGSTPRSSPTATSTTCSASTSTRRRRAPTAGPRRGSSRTSAIAERFDALPHDRRLQRGDQPAAVQGAGPAVADSSTAIPTRRTATRSTIDGRRRDVRAVPRPRRDRRRTWVWAPGAQGAVRGRPVHLGVAELRQPAEGAALRARLGDRVPQDGRARRRKCCCPATACRSSAPTACARRSTEGAELLESLARPDARDDERGRAPRRHRAHGAARPSTCSRGRTCSRSTTSPSSSCATSGACTAAGTTAIRRT